MLQFLLLSWVSLCRYTECRHAMRHGTRHLTGFVGKKDEIFTTLTPDRMVEAWDELDDSSSETSPSSSSSPLSSLLSELTGRSTIWSGPRKSSSNRFDPGPCAAPEGQKGSEVWIVDWKWSRNFKISRNFFSGTNALAFLRMSACLLKLV